MTLLTEIQMALAPLNIPVETGIFSEKAPEQYIVVVTMADTFEVHADNLPSIDVQEARISLYSQGSYTKAKNAVVKALLAGGLTITGRQYIGYETETGYHHYNVDVAQHYEMED